MPVYGIGASMSAIGVASARNGARTASASSGGPAQHMRPRITTLPCCSAGRNGIGGQGMTLAIVESPSGAASAASTNPAIVSAVAGSNSRPPTIPDSGYSRNLNRVTTPKLPPPPRTAQNRSGSCDSSTTWTAPSAVTISAASRLSIVSPWLRTR